MNLSTDQHILWQHGFVHINETMVSTWLLMLVMSVGAALITRRLRTDGQAGRWQNALEVIVITIQQQIGEIGIAEPQRYLGFLGTLFLFIAVATISTVFPGFEPPTASLSTTTALALCIFVAVPLFGIAQQGWLGYLKSYLEPTAIMLPFNIISEISRTLALAVRLFGNMMSGSMIIAILLTVTPFFFPIVMTLLGLLTGLVQAYIFSILATVYIAAAMQTQDGGAEPPKPLKQ